MSSYRPKFFCPEPTCRRSIKPFYDPDRFEYEISEFQEWRVRPLPSYSPGIAEAYRAVNRFWSMSRKNQATEELLTCRRLGRKHYNEPSSLSEEEYEYLKARSPSMWWKPIFEAPRELDQPGTNMVRCPSCGKSAIRVGSNFRIPKKKDEKAWKEIEKMIEKGEDMVAMFSFCATVEQYEKMFKRAVEIRRENMTEDEEEKQYQFRIANPH
jgi:hypothetical protein